ncbi:MAG: hypothetical protein ACTTKL_08245 [Treponema sp.]
MIYGYIRVSTDKQTCKNQQRTAMIMFLTVTVSAVRPSFVNTKLVVGLERVRLLQSAQNA